MRAPDASRLGLSVVELLIAGFILVIVLGLAGTFFAQQTQLQRDVQARNEVQDRVRVALQLVTQDIALVGNSVLVDASGAVEPAAQLPLAGCARTVDGTAIDSCFGVFEGPSAPNVSVALRYLSSQFDPSEACRDVRYQLIGNVLQRSDVECEEDTAWIDLATDILAFRAVVVCSDGERLPTFPDAACQAPAGYGRTAIVSVVGRSPTAVRTDDVPRDVITVNPGNTQATTFVPIPCTARRACFGGTEETLMPNLKDR